MSLKEDVAVNSDQPWRHGATTVLWRLRCCGLAAGWVPPEALETGSAAGGAGRPVVAAVRIWAQLSGPAQDSGGVPSRAGVRPQLLQLALG